MNSTMISAKRRRIAPALLVVAGLAFGSAGCGGDDTVRGAGSIDVPLENLKFQPKAKGSSKPPKAAQHP